MNTIIRIDSDLAKNALAIIRAGEYETHIRSQI